MKIRHMFFLTFQLLAINSALAENYKSSSSFTSQPVTVTTSDSKNRTISSCDDFIKLRQSDLKIISLNVEPDSFYREASDAMMGCNISWQASYNGLHKIEKIKAEPYEIFEHLPSSVVLKVSDEDKQSTFHQSNRPFNSLRPDMKVESGGVVSESNHEKYVISEHVVFSGDGDRKFEIIGITASLTGGTYVTTNYYEVLDKTRSVWMIKHLDWNSTL